MLVSDIKDIRLDKKCACCGKKHSKVPKNSIVHKTGIYWNCNCNSTLYHRPADSIIVFDENKISNKNGPYYIYYSQNLAQKSAVCRSCGRVSASNDKLPFFEQTNNEYDIYYCGCFGWD